MAHGISVLFSKLCFDATSLPDILQNIDQASQLLECKNNAHLVDVKDSKKVGRTSSCCSALSRCPTSELSVLSLFSALWALWFACQRLPLIGSTPLFAGSPLHSIRSGFEQSRLYPRLSCKLTRRAPVQTTFWMSPDSHVVQHACGRLKSCSGLSSCSCFWQFQICLIEAAESGWKLQATGWKPKQNLTEASLSLWIRASKLSERFCISFLPWEWPPAEKWLD